MPAGRPRRTKPGSSTHLRQLLRRFECSKTNQYMMSHQDVQILESLLWMELVRRRLRDSDLKELQKTEALLGPQEEEEAPGWMRGKKPKNS